MNSRENLKYTITLILNTLVLLVNILMLVHLNSHGGSLLSWSKNAATEAEAVAALSCSGHGRAYLDGVVLNGMPICECNECFGGHDCSQFDPECILDADSGNPVFLEPFWMKNAAESGIVVSGWHRMGYEYEDGNLISKELVAQILELHGVVGNVITRGRYIIFGSGSTQLLNAAVHALSLNSSSSSPAKIVASIPYYPVYKSQTEVFHSDKFSGDTSLWDKNSSSSIKYIEFVTSPNNPDGQLKKAVLNGSAVKTIHDLAYYWPHYSPITAPVNEHITIFTLSKLTGHAGSRFGWALIKDKDVHERMLTYMDLSTYGVPRETQLRALKLIKLLVEGKATNIFEFGYETMKSRWDKLSMALFASKRFSIQDLSSQYCTFFNKVRTPSPAFAWIKCERHEDEDCYAVLKSEAKIIGRAGTAFGAGSLYVRLGLCGSHDHFNTLLHRLYKLVSAELSAESKILNVTNVCWPISKGVMFL